MPSLLCALRPAPEQAGRMAPGADWCVQAADEMITAVQTRLQALQAPETNAKQQQEVDRSRSLSVVRAEREAHERCDRLCCLGRLWWSR